MGPMQIANEAPASFRSTASRQNAVDLVTSAWHEAISRRRLIGYLVRADIKKKGTDTLLGNVWWLLDPLIAMAVYVFVMTVIFQRRTPDFPIFLLSAVVPFKWFTQTLSDGVGSVVRSERLIKQIQFPKIVLPLSGAISEVVSFLFALAMLLVLTFFWDGGSHFSAMLLWLPVIMVVQFVFTLGLQLMVAALTVFYRDVGIVIGHLLRLLFFVSPILWSFGSSGGRGGDIKAAVGDVGFAILSYNPVAILLSAYRQVIYGQVSPDGESWTPPVPPDLAELAVLAVIAVVLLLLGTWIFRRLEPLFAKVL